MKVYTKKPNQQMNDYINNKTACKRVELFKDFDHWENTHDLTIPVVTFVITLVKFHMNLYY